MLFKTVNNTGTCEGCEVKNFCVQVEKSVLSHSERIKLSMELFDRPSCLGVIYKYIPVLVLEERRKENGNKI